MKFEDIAPYLKERGFSTNLVGIAPSRSLFVSVKCFSGTYFEDDWNTMDSEDHLNELEEMTEAVQKEIK